MSTKMTKKIKIPPLKFLELPDTLPVSGRIACHGGEMFALVGRLEREGKSIEGISCGKPSNAGYEVKFYTSQEQPKLFQK